MAAAPMAALVVMVMVTAVVNRFGVRGGSARLVCSQCDKGALVFDRRALVLECGARRVLKHSREQPCDQRSHAGDNELLFARHRQRHARDKVCIHAAEDDDCSPPQ